MSWCALADSTLFRLIKEDCRLPLTRKLACIDALHLEGCNQIQAGCRWLGWQPPPATAGTTHKALLQGQSNLQLADHFPAASLLRAADVQDLAAAERAFQRLLPHAEQPGQLVVLAELLHLVWQDGTAFGAQVQPFACLPVWPQVLPVQG